MFKKFKTFCSSYFFCLLPPAPAATNIFLGKKNLDPELDICIDDKPSSMAAAWRAGCHHRQYERFENTFEVFLSRISLF
jgi:hypothetical protein